MSPDSCRRSPRLGAKERIPKAGRSRDGSDGYRPQNKKLEPHPYLGLAKTRKNRALLEFALGRKKKIGQRPAFSGSCKIKARVQTTIGTMRANITTIVFLRMFIIQNGSTILLMGVEPQGHSSNLTMGYCNSRF